MTDFLTVFDRQYLPRLGIRAPTFRAVVREAVTLDVKNIVETGCLRKENNWDGDGQSSIIWTAFATYHHGSFSTIDIDQEALDLTSTLTGGRGRYVCADSVQELGSSPAWESNKIDLLYLDSFDVDMSNPHPAAKHCLFELLSARCRLRTGSIVFVDDSPYVNGVVGGKGMYVAEYFQQMGIAPFTMGYQIAWIIP